MLMQAIKEAGMKMTYLQSLERHEMLRNWSYLNIAFQETSPTRLELEELMYVEYSGPRRRHILERLYTRWAKLVKQEHLEELCP